jgi:signal transduction histidine kinase
MKYSDKHAPIHITAKGTLLSIRDEGIGMQEAELVRIFERYYQSDTAQQGEGIGLALVKAYCDESKIAITFSSRPGEGTTVKLNLKHILAT